MQVFSTVCNAKQQSPHNTVTFIEMSICINLVYKNVS